MKKKGKTKRVITICITVIMMLCIFIVPSNAATYQPVNDYNVIRYTNVRIMSEQQSIMISAIFDGTSDAIWKIYKLSPITGSGGEVTDIFEYEEEKSLLKWIYEGEEYVSSKISIYESNSQIGYLYHSGENILRITKLKTDSSVMAAAISNDEGENYSKFENGQILFVQTGDIEIIEPTPQPPSFVETTTTTMGVVLSWIALPITALLEGNWNPLLVMFGIGIAISGIFIAIKLIRKFIWGD